MSADMLREESAQGAEWVVCTPHFYANRNSIDRFLGQREHSFEELTDWCLRQPDQQRLPRLLQGAEVYYFSHMGRAEGLSRLCVSGTRTLLLEMPFEQWTQSMREDVYELVHRRKFTVVLAHVERYPEFQKDLSVWNSILEMPVIPQINAGSFLERGKDRHAGRLLGSLFGRNRKKKFCLEFLKTHPRLILGSDTHNLTSRRPNLADGRMAVAAEAGEEALRRIDATTREALNL